MNLKKLSLAAALTLAAANLAPLGASAAITAEQAAAVAGLARANDVEGLRSFVAANPEVVREDTVVSRQILAVISAPVPSPVAMAALAGIEAQARSTAPSAPADTGTSAEGNGGNDNLPPSIY